MKNRSILLATIIFIFITGISFAGDNNKNIPYLEISGEAKITVPADRIHIDISVVSIADTVQAAADQNTQKVNKIYTGLENLGLVKTEFQTSQYNIQPNYTPCPENPKPDWTPKIISYTITNSIKVTTTKLDLAGKIIQESTDIGANKIENISFDLSDPLKYRSEAIRQAAQKAILDAKALADATNVKIVKTLSVTSAAAYPPPAPGRNFVMLAQVDSAALPPRIEGGTTIINANIKIKYQIEDLK